MSFRARVVRVLVVSISAGLSISGRASPPRNFTCYERVSRPTPRCYFPMSIQITDGHFEYSQGGMGCWNALDYFSGEVRVIREGEVDLLRAPVVDPRASYFGTLRYDLATGAGEFRFVSGGSMSLECEGEAN